MIIKTKLKSKNIAFTEMKGNGFSKFQVKCKFLHSIKISAIMEMVESLNFSHFKDKWKISEVFLEVFDVFISVVNTKILC